jgi:hypothetical protein
MWCLENSDSSRFEGLRLGLVAGRRLFHVKTKAGEEVCTALSRRAGVGESSLLFNEYRVRSPG